MRLGLRITGAGAFTAQALSFFAIFTASIRRREGTYDDVVSVECVQSGLPGVYGMCIYPHSENVQTDCSVYIAIGPLN